MTSYQRKYLRIFILFIVLLIQGGLHSFKTAFPEGPVLTIKLLKILGDLGFVEFSRQTLLMKNYKKLKNKICKYETKSICKWKRVQHNQACNSEDMSAMR